VKEIVYGMVQIKIVNKER